MMTFVKTALAALALTAVAVCSGPARAQDACEHPYAEFYEEVKTAVPDITVRDFTADERELLVADAAKATGRDLSQVNKARFLHSSANETAAIFLMNGECIVLAAQGPEVMIRALIERALGKQT